MYVPACNICTVNSEIFKIVCILAKYLGVRSRGCDADIHQECNYFCVTCLTQARRNPLECPSHGPAEPPIGKYLVIIRRCLIHENSDN